MEKLEDELLDDGGIKDKEVKETDQDYKWGTLLIISSCFFLLLTFLLGVVLLYFNLIITSAGIFKVLKSKEDTPSKILSSIIGSALILFMLLLIMS